MQHFLNTFFLVLIMNQVLRRLRLQCAGLQHFPCVNIELPIKYQLHRVLLSAGRLQWF